MSRRRPRDNNAEIRIAKALDDLAAFEEFQAELLPALRGAIQAGKTADDIYKMAEAMAAARAVTIAATEKDSGKALAAIREVLDRSKGKATERREIAHKYEKLKDEELDALILSELAESGEDATH